MGKTEEEVPSSQHFKEDFKSTTWSLLSTTLGVLPKAPESECLSRRKVARFAGNQWAMQIVLFQIMIGAAAMACEHPGD